MEAWLKLSQPVRNNILLDAHKLWHYYTRAAAAIDARIIFDHPKWLPGTPRDGLIKMRSKITWALQEVTVEMMRAQLGIPHEQKYVNVFEHDDSLISYAEHFIDAWDKVKDAFEGIQEKYYVTPGLTSSALELGPAFALSDMNFREACIELDGTKLGARGEQVLKWYKAYMKAMGGDVSDWDAACDISGSEDQSETGVKIKEDEVESNTQVEIDAHDNEAVDQSTGPYFNGWTESVEDGGHTLHNFDENVDNSHSATQAPTIQGGILRGGYDGTDDNDYSGWTGAELVQAPSQASISTGSYGAGYTLGTNRTEESAPMTNRRINITPTPSVPTKRSDSAVDSETQSQLTWGPGEASQAAKAKFEKFQQDLKEAKDSHEIQSQKVHAKKLEKEEKYATAKDEARRRWQQKYEADKLAEQRAKEVIADAANVQGHTLQTNGVNESSTADDRNVEDDQGK